MSETSMVMAAPQQLTPQQQQGWLSFGQMKQDVFSSLQQYELAVQGTLTGIDQDRNLEVVQGKLKTAKQQMNEAIARRKELTRLLDEKVITPSMEFEKRMAENIKQADAFEFQLRKAIAAQQEAANLKNSEIANLRAHIKNEYYRIAATYRMRLELNYGQLYKACLETGCLMPIEDVKATLVSISIPAFEKKPLQYISTEEAMSVFSEVEPYNPVEDLNKAITEAVELFSRFDNDMANAEAAKKALDVAIEETTAAVKSEIEINAGVNNLVTASEVTALPVGPKIKKTVAVVVENTPQWAIQVMAHFLKNQADTFPLLRVKNWDKLTTGQMATALGALASATGEAFDGLTLEVVEK